MNTKKILTVFILAAAAVFINLTCTIDSPLTAAIADKINADLDTSDEDGTTISVTGVSLDKASMTLTVGGTEQLTATVEPADASDTSVSWTSDNESVAAVDADGLVTGIAEGTASITVTTTDGGFTASCNVTVVLPTCTITYDANDATHGTAPEDSTEYVSGETITVADNTGSLSIDDTVDRDFIYWNTTVDGSGAVYLPGDTITAGGANIVLHAQFIGDPGPGGGYVFHDKGSYSDGWRYLEAAPSGWDGTMDPVEDWSNVDDVLIGTTETVIGSGSDNTDDIIGQDGHSSSAAKLCRDFGDEWFLPSKDELNGMYNNLHRNGIGGFASDFYWSSSEGSSYHAWKQDFSDGSQRGSDCQRQIANQKCRL